MTAWFMGLKTRTKLLLIAGIFLAITVFVGIAFPSAGRNNDFKPQNEFKLDAWIPIKIGPVDLSINKAVLYLVLAAALTTGTMVYIARRMNPAHPNRLQTAVESAYAFIRDQIAGPSLDTRMAQKWFAFIGTLFLFIWFSNLLGYIPLPTNSEETINIFGVEVPAFGIYAATANLSAPLALTLLVWVSYQVEGIRAKGFTGYLSSWIPAGTPRALKPLLFAIEVISQFVRIISLSVRLFANILAGHLLILFMGGGLVVLLGLAAIGVVTLPLAVIFFLFEVVLIATLQAFIFATLTAIYLGESVAESH
jgi:F-type H+-transporting ATPase subunit a